MPRYTCTVFFSLAAGVAITLSLQPFNLWPLAIVSTAVLYKLLRDQPLKKSYFIALVFNFGLFLSGASWVYVSIHEFGYVSPLLAATLTLIFCTGIAAINALSLCSFSLLQRSRKSAAGLNILSFAGVATASEAIRSWIFTGFPWLNIGYSQTDTLLSGYAPLVGVYGISFLLYTIGGLLIETHQRHKNDNFSWTKTTAHFSSVILIFAVGLALQFVDWTKPAKESQQVAMIQTNISQHDKWKPAQLRPTLNLYQTMSLDYWSNSDLIIWPEAAIPVFYEESQGFFQRTNSLAIQHNSALLSGVPTIDADENNSRLPKNSVVVLGRASGIYHKQHLVPFGEYIPLKNIFGKLMEFFELPMSGMQAGSKNQLPLTIQDWKTRPLICYEIVYPSLTAKAAAVSDVLITVSNDSWFGGSIGPIQHLQMAQMRALENGKYLLRATGNGISAIIDHKGNVIQRSQQFKREVLTGEFFQVDGSTPWTRFGHWLVHYFYLSPIALQIYYIFRQRQKKKPLL